MTQAVEYQTDTSDMLIPHAMFRTSLASAGRIVAGASRGDAEQTAMVASYLDNVLRFLDAHHEGEDAVVWPVLAVRSRAAAELLARMQGQHAAIHELREKAGAALTAWTASGSQEDGRELASALQGLAAEIDIHFGEEEAEILPVASRNMSPQEWGQLPGHAMQHFTGDKIWLILGLVFEQMTPEQLAVTLQHLPPPVVQMWDTTGRATFEEFIARVRATA
ncbi:MAG TPA: hemerythrin domain-containing protein [Candidatus Dormibacteraeota bacterium]